MTMPADHYRRGRTAALMLALALCAACGDKDATTPAKGEETAAPPVAAAPAPAAAPAASEEVSTPPAPTVVSTEYGDWIVNCQTPSEGPRQCEAVQTLAADKKPIARIAVGRNPETGALAIAVNLPPAVGFGLPVTLTGEKAEDPQIVLTWRRCAPAGCFADTTPPAKVFAAWSTLAGKGRLVFLDFNDNPVTMPMSFRGLAEAIKGLDESP